MLYGFVVCRSDGLGHRRADSSWQVGQRSRAKHALVSALMRQGPFRNVIEYGLALGVVKSLEWAPAPLAHGLARGYARLLDLAIPRLRRVAKHNLSMALPGAPIIPKSSTGSSGPSRGCW